MSRPHQLLTILVATLFLLTSPAAGVAGTWKLEFDGRDDPSLTYSEDGKIIFLLGCGHAFGLHAKYPGTPKKSGSASITISSAHASMKLVGEFEEPVEDDETTFVQWDLGFSRQDPDLYGRRWDRILSRLLDLIERADPVIISQGRNSYRLPYVDAAGWRAAVEKCGRD